MDCESFSLQIKNQHCFFCKKGLTKEEEEEEEQPQDIIILKCGHSYHLKCGKDWVIQPKTVIKQMKEQKIPVTKCPECLLSESDFNVQKQKSLNSRWIDSTKFEEIKNSTFKPQFVSSKQVLYNNYPVSPHQYLSHLKSKEEYDKEDERINGLTISSNSKTVHTTYSSSEEEEEEEDLKLEPSKKRKFVPIIKWASMGNIVIDYNYLKENGYDNMQYIYKSNVNIQEIYFIFGIDQWNDLVDKLSFSKDYLANGELYPIKFLVSKYFISYTDLVKDLDMELNDFIDFGFTPEELILLNLNLNNLISDFMIKKSDIIKFRFKINEWYTLGMDFKSLLKLKFSIKDYEKAGWKQSLIEKYLKLTKSEKNTLGFIDNNSNSNTNGNSEKIRRKKKTNNQ